MAVTVCLPAEPSSTTAPNLRRLDRSSPPSPAVSQPPARVSQRELGDEPAPIAAIPVTGVPRRSLDEHEWAADSHIEEGGLGPARRDRLHRLARAHRTSPVVAIH